MNKKITLILLFAFAAVSSYSQTVFKYSGVQYTGTGNYTAIRSKVLDSQVYSSPLGIEIDTAGRIYITNEHNIFLLFNGKSKLMAGYNLDPVDGSDYKNGTGIASRFSQPAGIAVNRSTNSMVIVDMGNNLIRSLSPYLNSFTDETAGFIAGTKSFVGGWADGAVATAKFNVPDGVAVNTNGDIYVSDRDGHCIRKISGGNVTTIAGTHGTSGNKDGTGIAATFMNPRGLYLESSTSLLVADYGNQRIRRINLTTNAVTTVISSGLDGPSDLCVVNGQMYITDILSVKKYDGTTTTVFAGSTSISGYVEGVGTAARFENLTAIAYNKNDKSLYVVDNGNNLVRRISTGARPVISFTANTTIGSVGQNIQIRSTSSGNPDSHKWSIIPSNYSLQNNSKLTDTVIYVQFTATGSYNVQLREGNSGGNDSLLKSGYIIISNITAKPVVDFTANDREVAVGDAVNFIDLSTNGPTSWIWQFTPNTVTYLNGTSATDRYPLVSFNNNGLYAVQLTAANGSGSASSSKTDYIDVNATASVAVINNDLFTVYPNPTTGLINIKGAEILSAELMTVNGVSIFQSAGASTIDLNGQPKGIYILRITDTNKVVSYKRVILE